MIFCQQQTPYPHKVRVKYRRRREGHEEWYCPDCGKVYMLETDVVRESAPNAPTAKVIEGKQLRMEDL